MKTVHFSHSTITSTAVVGFIIALISGSLYAQAAPSNPASATVPVDPAAHAAHAAAGTQHPAAAPVPAAAQGAKVDPALAELRAKVTQLETALAKNAPPAANPAMNMGMGKMKPGGMAGMDAGANSSSPMAGMGGGSMPAPGMMGMMDKMMGMMGKMMDMGGMGAAAPMPAGAPAAPMGGGMGMGMDSMEVAGMMGMGAMGGAAPGAVPQSALPGFPGSSHLYHIGATGFFLDHPQHIALTTDQQAGLNKAKEQALLAKSTAARAVEQAEQELWMLTAADQPDIAKIEMKIAEIGKLRGDERIAFIRSVGEASKLLTDDQRKSLTGFAPPVSAVPAAAPMAGGMSDM